MRRTVTKAIKVQPYDEVIVRAALPPDSRLARLYVWAKQSKSNEFSPYAVGQEGGGIVLNGQPIMLTPLNIRLVEQRPSHQISFRSDIEGQIVIVQEVDTRDDKVAEVNLDLHMANRSKIVRFKRRLTEWPKTVTL